MFKNLLAFIFLFVSIVISQAQITLTSNNAYEVDLVVNYSTTVVSGNNQDVGQAGADVEWDFSQIVSGPTATTTIIDASNASNGQFFPGANLAIDDGGNNQAFYSASTGAFSFWGAFTASGAEVIYTDAQDFLRFPFTYEDTYTDTFGGTATTNVIFDRMGTAEVTCDGYGTLITPAGTFENVVRIKTVMDYGDFYSGYEVLHYAEERYEWFNSVEKFPILAINAFDFGIGGQGTVVSYIEGTSTATTAPTELKSLSLSPNPASEFINIQVSSLNSSNELNVEIFNQVGQRVLADVVAEISISEGLHLNIEELTAGTYFLILRDGVQLLGREKLVVIN